MTGLSPDALSTAIESLYVGDERETVVTIRRQLRTQYGACSDLRRAEGEASRETTDQLVKKTGPSMAFPLLVSVRRKAEKYRHGHKY